MEPIFFATPQEWRAWLEEHHDTETEVLVGFYKKATGRPSITWPEAVDQALCFGWIDGVRRRIDDETYAIRFTPRRPTSKWSAVNARRMQELEEAGLVHPAGRVAFERRRAADYSYEREEAARLAPGQERRFRGSAAAWTYFESRPPWYRRAATHWVTSAKRPETRERRLSQLIEDSAAGRTVAPLTPPGKRQPTE